MNQLVLTCPSQFLLGHFVHVQTNVNFGWNMSVVQPLFQALHYVCMYVCVYVITVCI